MSDTSHVAGRQPAFDPRHRPANPLGAVTFRGAIKGESEVLAFQFNPYEVTISHRGDAVGMLPIGALDPSQAGVPMNPGGPGEPPQGSISFELFFDRTYEVIGGSELGVLADIQALERIAGITEAEPVMRQNPVTILLGEPTNFVGRAVLQTFGVNYTHFSHAMVPMRATVAITAQRLASPAPVEPPQWVVYGPGKPLPAYGLPAFGVPGRENFWGP